MVDFAKKQDYEDIAKIWRMSFSDTDSYIKQFWDAMFQPQNTLVYRECGVVVAMFFFLESQTVIKGKRYSTLYLYAAATLPKYRKRGYMSQLIEKGIEVAKQRNVDFIVLVPAEKYLFNYYSKFGFKTAFKKKTVKLTRNQLISVMEESQQSNQIDLFKIRKMALAPYNFLNWDSDTLNYALKEHLYTHGLVVYTDKGYAMYEKGKNTLYIKEMCSIGSLGELFYLLLQKEDTENFVFNLPVDFPFSAVSADNSKIVDVGMIKSLNENSNKALLNMNNGYIGISLG